MTDALSVFITGAGGQLGTDLTAHCVELGDEVTAFTRDELDITDAAAVAAAIEAAQPDVVFNCAAWTAVDACESDPDRAELVNATAAGHVAAAAAAAGAHLVLVSTDYVFSGDKPEPYVETDEPDPRSVYGESKLKGEQLVGPDATIVRTSWVCSAHGGNMVATIMRLVNDHPVLRFVSDQRGRPTFTSDLAVALRTMGVDRVPGIVNVANEGAVSWHEFAQQILIAADLDPARVEPILTADLDPPRPAPRPANSVLSTAKYEALGYPPMRHFTAPLAEAIPAYR